MTHENPNDAAGDKLILNSPDSAATAKDFALWIGVLALVTLTVYSPVLHGKFLWEDDRNVMENRALRNADGLKRIWLSPRSQAQYQPLTQSTFWAEYQLLGADERAELSPLLFHLTNIILHAGSATLLWFVLRGLRVPGSWIAAAAWALHPVQVEAAAWISERGTVLSGVFFFGTVLAYLRSGFAAQIQANGSSEDQHPKPDIEFYFLALLLFVLGLLSKPQIWPLPIVLLCVMWWRNSRADAREYLRLLPFLVIGIAIAWWTSYIEVSNLAVRGPEWSLSISQRLLLAGHAFWFYVAKLFLPVRLSLIYPEWDLANAPAWAWLCPAAVVVLLVLLWALRRRIGRAPFAAAASYFVMLLPWLGIFSVYPMRHSYVVDHFQYHASSAVIALVIGLAARVVERMIQRAGPREEASPAPYVAAAVLLVALAGTSLARAMAFSGPVPLWRDTLAKNPKAWVAHNNLGYTLYEDVMKVPPAQRTDDLIPLLDEAESHFAEAIKLKPDHDRAYMNWGTLLLARGKPEAAAQKFADQLRVDPGSIAALEGLARALAQQQKFPEAIARYREAIARADPSVYVARTSKATLHLSLADTLMAAGDVPAALVEYAAAIRLKDDLPQAHLGYAGALAKSGRLVEAAEECATAIRLDPDSVEGRVELARLKMRVGQLEAAQALLIAAARIDPHSQLALEAATEWDAKMKEKEASTRPATTKSATTGSAATTKTTGG
jgi:tetratricopeptide (TPR) repeat protein